MKDLCVHCGSKAHREGCPTLQKRPTAPAMETSKIAVRQNDDGSYTLEIDDTIRGRYASAKEAVMYLGLCIVRLDELEGT